MEDKKQQENDEIVREPETDKESCQQDAKECSEEKVETTENDKSAEETVDPEGTNPDGITESSDQNKKPEDALNNRADHDVSDDENKINIREVLGKEVTWAAIAALGGAAIVIWNIIRYIFIWGSSFSLYLTTNVPIYLLEQRKNVGFTNFYLVYFTSLIVIMIISFTKYDFLPRIKIQTLTKLIKILYILLLFISAIWFLNLLILRHTPDMDLANKIEYCILCILMFIVSYIIPFMQMIIILTFGRKPGTCKNSVNIDRVMYFFKKYYKDKNPDKETIDLDTELKQLSKSTWMLVGIFCTMAFLLMIYAFIFWGTINTYQLVDQDNRIIVADLGEHYIVQETQYDKNKRKLIVDNSFYYVIDATDEKVKIFRGLYTPKE